MLSRASHFFLRVSPFSSSLSVSLFLSPSLSSFQILPRVPLSRRLLATSPTSECAFPPCSSLSPLFLSGRLYFSLVARLPWRAFPSTFSSMSSLHPFVILHRSLSPLSLRCRPFTFPSARAASPHFPCIFGCSAAETVQRPPLVSELERTYIGTYMRPRAPTVEMWKILIDRRRTSYDEHSGRHYDYLTPL